MIAIYGPAGAGKSTQGQLLAKKLGRKWLSAGEIIRNSGKFNDFTKKGAMIDERTLVRLISTAVKEANSEGYDVVFDGQPGSPEQIDYWREAGLLDKLECVILLTVPEEESIRRLKDRGRADDNMSVWKAKLAHFEQKIYSFLTPVKSAKIPIYEISGLGTPSDVLTRILYILRSQPA